MAKGILKRGKRSSTYRKNNGRTSRNIRHATYKRGTKKHYKKNARTRAFAKFQFKKRAEYRRSAAPVRNDAKYKRREKKINKALSRVLTDMNDDVATMYRQCVDKYAHVVDTDGDAIHLDDASASAIQNGNFVSAKSAVLQSIVKRNESNFFQVDAFHGMIAPSWKRFNHNDIPVNTDGTLTDNQIHNEVGDTPTGTASALALGSKIDIRAFAQIELPFLPCIPRQVNKQNNNYPTDYRHEFDQFCRNNNKIKIKTNYFRFRFFATNNGMVVNKSLDNPFEDSGLATYNRLEMDGTFSNIEPTFTMAGNTARLQQTQWNTQAVNSNGASVTTPDDIYVQQLSNVAKEYKIAARRFAKVRIILYERDQEEEYPVQFEQFMRYGQHNLDSSVLGMAKMPGGALMVSEEYRLHKRFASPRKTKRDYVYQADADLEERLNAGKIVIDKVLNLPMGKEVVYTCNPIAGTVLEYDDSTPTQYDDTFVLPPNVTTTTDASEQNLGLPLDVNTLGSLYQPKPDPGDISSASEATLNSMRQKAEYKPKKKQYGMFMLMYCQRAGIEYDVFQKFQYDK